MPPSKPKPTVVPQELLEPQPEPKPESASPEPSGASTDAETPSVPLSSESSVESTPDETPAIRELREKMEAKAAAEPERPPHPYKWRIECRAMIPFAMLDPATGEPSKERIEAHIEDCWRVGTAPDIAGVLVTQPRSQE